jgi:hypothetical protein
MPTWEASVLVACIGLFAGAGGVLLGEVARGRREKAAWLRQQRLEAHATCKQELNVLLEVAARYAKLHDTKDRVDLAAEWRSKHYALGLAISRLELVGGQKAVGAAQAAYGALVDPVDFERELRLLEDGEPGPITSAVTAYTRAAERDVRSA